MTLRQYMQSTGTALDELVARLRGRGAKITEGSLRHVVAGTREAGKSLAIAIVRETGRRVDFDDLWNVTEPATA